MFPTDVLNQPFQHTNLLPTEEGDIGRKPNITYLLAAESEVGGAVNAQVTLACHPVAQVDQALPLMVLLVASVQDLELFLKHQHTIVTVHCRCF